MKSQDGGCACPTYKIITKSDKILRMYAYYLRESRILW